MNDDDHLREMARKAVRTETLPNCMPDRSWGGKGAGAICAICGACIKQEQLELEIEFDAVRGLATRNYHVHVPCFTVWTQEVHRFAQQERPPRTGRPPSQATAREQPL